MNNKLIKYKENIWNKINNKFKMIFYKKNNALNKEVDVTESPVQAKQNLDSKDDKDYQEMKNRFVFLVMELESGRMVETDLSLDEIKMITKYYKKEIDGLDKKLLEQDETIFRLNAYYNMIQHQNA